MDWNAVEDALQAWVRSSTGLSDSQVIWSSQTGPRPAGAFITLHVSGLVAVGVVDEVRDDFDALRPEGEEVHFEVTGTRELSVSLQAFGEVLSASGARGLLSRLQTGLVLPTVRETLALAGLTPFDVGAVSDVPALVGTRFEGRAAMTVRFYARDTLTEAVGYIDTVNPPTYFWGPPDSGTAGSIDL